MRRIRLIMLVLAELLMTGRVALNAVSRHMIFRYALVILGFVLAGCGQAPATTSTTVGAPLVDHAEHGPGKEIVVIDYDAASVLVTLNLMRGHLISSLESVRLDDYSAAQQHAARPLAEHYAQIKTLVQDSDAAGDAQLEAAFKTYQQQLVDKADIETIEQGNAAVEAQIDAIEGVLVPIHADVHSRALAGVIQAAAQDYTASIKDGAFVAPSKYQDAFGFTRVAEAHFARLKPELRAETAQTTQAALDALKTAMPTITPPQPVVDPAALSADIEKFIQPLQ